jgi:hypothetical protein
MRTEKKYPINDRAQRSAVRVLKRGYDDGHDPNKMLDNSIQACWQGLFTHESTVRKNRPASHGHGPQIEAVEINREAGRSHLQAIKGGLK